MIAMQDAVALKRERRILAAISHLWVEGDVHEMRILGSRRGVVSGYFNAPAAFAACAAKWDVKANIYWTINPINPALLKLANNRLREGVQRGGTTSDADIIRRRYLPIDIDPTREPDAEGQPATHEEHCEALALQGRIADSDIWDMLGFPRPVEMDSGNGAYLLYPVDLPNDDASKMLIKRCLEALAAKFNCSEAKIDTTTFNASRILRVPGTLNCKGTPTLERPYRRAILTIVPGLEL